MKAAAQRKSRQVMVPHFPEIFTFIESSRVSDFKTNPYLTGMGAKRNRKCKERKKPRHNKV